MYRFVLLRLAEDDHVLAVTTHHATMDEWSLGLLSRELGQLYDARTHGKPSPLPELTVQYADYAHWQRQWYEQEGANALGYWRSQLEHLPLLELATDRARPPEQTFRGTIWGFELPRELADAAKQLAVEENCTFFMTMLATFQVLLARYSGQEDIVVGTPVANRRSAAIEPLIGLFLNTLVLRTDLGREPSFREALQRVREMALGAFRHQDMPFEQLVVELRPERDLSRNPLFQVLFQLNEPWSELPMGEVSAAPFPLQSVSAKFDLTLSMSDAGDRVYAGFEYNQDLFDEATVEQMSRHFVRLLEAIGKDADRSIWDLPMLSDDEQQRLFAGNKQTERDYTTDRCFHQLFEEQVAACARSLGHHLRRRIAQLRRAQRSRQPARAPPREASALRPTSSSASASSARSTCWSACSAFSEVGCRVRAARPGLPQRPTRVHPRRRRHRAARHAGEPALRATRRTACAGAPRRRPRHDCITEQGQPSTQSLDPTVSPT